MQQPPVQAAPTVIKNVTYLQAGEVNLKLDIYMPERTGTFPAIVLIHGGQYHRFDKCQQKYVAQARHFVSAGFVVYNINYRLAPKYGTYSTVFKCADGTTTNISFLQGHHFPAAIDDATAAVEWVRANGGSYKTDVSRVSCVGESAGGALCYGLGTREVVNAQAGWSGPTKLDENFNVPISENYLGCTLSACPDAWRDASPYYGVTTTTGSAAIYNSSTEVIPRSQADLYSQALTDSAVVNQKTILSGSKHAINFANLILPNGKAVWRDTASFIATHD